MLNLPRVKEPDTSYVTPRMTLEEYAHFSEVCLMNNSRITPENCLQIRNDEASIKTPFSLDG